MIFKKPLPPIQVNSRARVLVGTPDLVGLVTIRLQYRVKFLFFYIWKTVNKDHVPFEFASFTSATFGYHTLSREIHILIKQGRSRNSNKMYLRNIGKTMRHVNEKYNKKER